MTPQPTSARPTYLWQHAAWPALEFDPQVVVPALERARLEQGRLQGLLGAIGLSEVQDLQQQLWVEEAIATSAIEGEMLDLHAVRSSVAHRLGLVPVPGSDRHVDGLVSVMQDATENQASPLDADRLCRWHSALFPGGTSGITRIAVGQFRSHEDAMQIVSGVMGREVVHFEAPPSARVPHEMERFLGWFAATRPTHAERPTMNGLARAALAHLWFETIHPFEDGNGRIGRAVVDMALAQDMNIHDKGLHAGALMVFGMARQLLKKRTEYYAELNAATRLVTDDLKRPVDPAGNTIDVTRWVHWFVSAFGDSCAASQVVVKQALDKSAFWLRTAQAGVNERQQKVLERLLRAGNVESGGGFLGGMTAEKYAKITGVSKATATRDLTDLASKKLLRVEGAGKATRYAVSVPGWQQPVTS